MVSGYQGNYGNHDYHRQLDMSTVIFYCMNMFGGVLTQKNQKKTSRFTKIGKLALVFFGFFLVFFGFLKFPNWHWFFLVFFLGFFGFLALVLARIRNWKLVFLVFFGFFLVFLA